MNDMTIPGMTGASLAREAQVLHPDIKIILCTGFSESMDESRANEMGIDAFLQKPVPMKILAATVH